jgi:hypothetical protein
MRTLLMSALLLAATGAQAAQLDLSIEIPKIAVAEYHKPYVAIWIEHEDQKVAAQLAVWYQQKAGREGDGTKWLPDLRQWWRRGGRALKMPVDGVSGATRAVGVERLNFSGDEKPLKDLAAGKYVLVVEAAREVGGRELLRIPFQWPPQASAHLDAQGKTELGAIQLDLSP